MTVDDPAVRLAAIAARIAEHEQAAEALKPERDALILAALKAGMTHRAVAELARVSYARPAQIRRRDTG